MKELLDVLNTQLSDNHASKLEWIVIILIVVEVIIQLAEILLRDVLHVSQILIYLRRPLDTRTVTRRRIRPVEMTKLKLHYSGPPFNVRLLWWNPMVVVVVGVVLPLGVRRVEECFSLRE